MCLKGVAQRFQFNARSQWKCRNMKAAVIAKRLPQFERPSAQLKLTENFISKNSEWPLAIGNGRTGNGRDELASCYARQKVIGNFEVNQSPFFVTTVVDFHEG